MSCVLREFRAEEAARVNQLALAAFDEYRAAYTDWPAMARNIGNMAALAQQGELIVAEIEGVLAGAVVYVGPGKAKARFFDPAWPIIRMLVVDPAARGQGIGRALTQACIQRAVRDGACCIALHTTPIMQIALPMYQRMGFAFVKDAPPICGVPYGVYVKLLESA